MQLIDLFEDVPADRLLWAISPDEEYTASQLRAWCIHSRQTLLDLRGKKVAVLATGDFDLALMLLCLDGWAESLTLLTAGSDQISDAICASGCEVLLVRQQMEFAPPIPVRVAPPFSLNVPNASNEALLDQHCRTRWVLSSSGTTGQPKLISHSLSSLVRTVSRDLDRGSNFVWGSLYHVSSFAGIQVLLQSWFAGSKLVFSVAGVPLSKRIASFAACGCNALSATPTLWRVLMMSDHGGLRLRQVTLGGEIADQAILDALRARFRDANLVHIFASTEAGVGFSVRDGREGFPARLLIEPPNGVRLRVDAQGHLWLKPLNSDQRLAHGKQELRDEDGFIDTGDVVELVGDRYQFRGRSTGAINVGGRKVHPQEVESWLLRYPGVRLARVSAKKNPIMGSIVQATVVLSEGCDGASPDFKSGLTRFCREHLEPYKIPAILRVAESIPVSDTGKIART
ncbi:MAG: fatty acid--CoA ligase family protein [Planctomycetota bacterium]